MAKVEYTVEINKYELMWNCFKKTLVNQANNDNMDKHTQGVFSVILEIMEKAELEIEEKIKGSLK